MRRLPLQETKRARFRGAGRSVLVFGASLLSLALVAPTVMAADNYRITVIRNVEAKMRDGVTLRADVYRPTAEGRYPVLLVRTP